MKIKFVILFIFQTLLLHANMASPVSEGTLGTRPFISEHVSIIKENLRITLDENFQYADFDVEYIINAQKSGTQIPLLFYASDYYENFQVTIDGKPISLQRQEDFWDEYNLENKKLTNFHYLYTNDQETIANINNQFNDGINEPIYLKDFLYFETDLTEGEHIIKVTYKATNWTYDHSRLKEDSFRYALAPAKYWKSFGTLNVTIDATKVNDTLAVNLGTPDTGDINGVATYTFNELPVEMLQITRVPELTPLATYLLEIESFWLAIIFMLPIVLYHIWKMYAYRRRRPKKFFSIYAFMGAVIIPFVFIFMLLLSTFLIDMAIGDEYASGRMSYGAFFEFLYFPKYLFIYVIFSIVTDFIFKKIHAGKVPKKETTETS